MLRNLINRLSGFIAERSHPPRRRCELPVKVWFDVDSNADLHSSEIDLYLSGETVDLSQSGIGMLLPAIRIKEKYLVGQDRVLNIQLDLPSGSIRLKAIGRRYEREVGHLSSEKFLIGVEITQIEKKQKEAYEEFLQFGFRQGKAASPGLELGR
jgi:c-di-GMP-binding flagellar brake protein YcgR